MALRLPGLRECPREILLRFREIDETLDCVDVGEGEWVLGSVRWSWPACLAAQESIRSELRLPAARERAHRIELLQLTVRHGFRPIARYRCPEPDGGMIEDMRERDYNFRVRPAETFRDRFTESDDEPGLRRRQAVLSDKIDSERRSLDRFLQQSPKDRGRHRLVPALPW